MNGPALGLYQIEPSTHRDVWNHYLKYRQTLSHAIQQLKSDDESWATKDRELITNLAYSTAIARLIYYRVREPLPNADNIPALAAYWKQHYNTALGKGQVSEFIKHYAIWVG